MILWRIVAVLASIATPAAARAQAIDAAAYDRAARVFDVNLRGLVANAAVQPHWIEGGAAFWYERRGAGGTEFVVVDARTGAKRPAFDPARLAAAARRVNAKLDVKAARLPVTAIVREGSGTRVSLDFGTARLECRTDADRCEAAAPPPAPDPGWLVSPDGRAALFRRGDDLWLRDVAGGRETRLTHDGAPAFAYGKWPDNTLAAVPRLRDPAPEPPAYVGWSPDSRHVFGVRVDERAVAPYPFVEQVPQDGSARPKLYSFRLGLLGDKGEQAQENFILDTVTGRRTAVTLPEGWFFVNTAVDWSRDGRFAYGAAETFGKKRLALVETDMTTGKARVILVEEMPTYASYNAFLYSQPNIRILERSGEAIWFSERDGWGHLYLYDLRTGRLKRQLSKGRWLVRDLIAVDERGRQAYFTAGGKAADEDPYLDQLHRVPLDGGAPVRLTPEPADHAVAGEPIEQHGGAVDVTTAGVAPDYRSFVDSYSTVKEPPVSVLRSTADGRIIARLETADPSANYAAGWRAPERVRVKAADGATDLYAVVYFPPNLVPGKRYPVIDAFYGGPQMTNSPADFLSAVTASNPVSRSSLAQLGFIVVSVDGRGTPGRSKAFTDRSYGRFIEDGIADHVAAIRQLADRYGNFDLDRVGVYGHSFGGYTSARAILSRPDFYKVAVSSAGPHNFQSMYSGPIESWFGIPDYGKGARFREAASAVPAPYDTLDNGKLAANLKGKLMLVYGDMDENAVPAATLQLADALQKANKSFDLLYLPNRRHDYFRTDPYMMRRIWDYFVEHLAGQRPPDDYRLTYAPPRAP